MLTFERATWTALLALALAPALASAQTGQPIVKLALASGSVLTAEMEQTEISWSDVDENGAKNKRSIKIEDIEQIVLVASEASKGLLKVRKLLTELGNTNYSVREKAEKQLSDARVSGDFISLIRAFKETADFETQFRIDRVLSEINRYSDSEPANLRLDEIRLKNGSKLAGEMSESELSFSYLGQTVTLARKAITKISTTLPVESKRNHTQRNHTQRNVAPRVTTFNQAGDFYDAPDQTIIDFQTDPFGNQFSVGQDLATTYSTYGLLTGAEETRRHFGAAIYKFKKTPIEIEGNQCATVVVRTSSGKSLFEGTAEFTFCVPGETANPAGVHRFGMLFAEVEHARDFVVEAFDAHGNLLGNVESTDHSCCFAGFESSIPIAKVQIKQNPYLDRDKVQRKIDRTYACDNLVFTTPVAIENSINTKSHFIRLKNGDKLTILASAELDGKSISCSDPFNPRKKVKIPLSDVETIVYRKPNYYKSSTDPAIWMAMLRNQSINFALVNEDGITVKDFAKRDVDLKDVVCLWPAGSTRRLPEAGDFVEGKKLLLYPSCRIQAEDFAIGEKEFSWSKDSRKITQKVNLEAPDADDAEEPDPFFTPAENKYVYGTKGQRPTIWLEAPQPLDRSVGRIILFDGSHLLFGGDTGTELARLLRASLLLKTGKQKTVIRNQSVAAIMFPIEQASKDEIPKDEPPKDN